MSCATSDRDPVVLATARTPIGRRNGSLASVHPVDLSAPVLAALADRANIDPALIEDVLWGCVSQVGEQAANVGRLAALAAGWSQTVAGTTIDRACGSSQQAIHFAAAGVAAGHYDIVVAGGVEAMSRVPMGSARRAGPGLPYGDRVRARFADTIGAEGEFSQGWAAELIAERWSLSRTELDEFALRSHALAAQAQDQYRSKAEIVPVVVVADDGRSVEIDQDEGIRRGGTPAGLAALSTPFKSDGRVTAGNASQISDGAAAVLIASRAAAQRLGLRPIARFRSFAVVGVDPVEMLTGPIPATEAALARAGLPIDSIGVFEMNEAFASVALAWQRDTGAGPDRVNPSGGAIALGHPLGASGARLLSTLVNHMVNDGVQFGLQTMCEGGGMANAMIVELA